jgi:uncharacterized protein YhhL (DUF1145 family)
MAPNHRMAHRTLQVLTLTSWVLGALSFTSAPGLLGTPLDAWVTGAARVLWWFLVLVHPIGMLVFAPTLRRKGRLDARNLFGLFLFGGIHMLGIRWTEAAQAG